VSAVPQRIDRYLLEGELGRGSFGAVYRAKHAVMGRLVALKVLHPERTTSPSVLERFLGEARAVAAIGSPSIVQVFDAGLTPDGKAFVAMELLEGEDLAAHLSRHGRLPAPRAIEIAQQICRALSAAHQAGVIHRDLKPANVYLARGPDGRAQAKVLDFGVSKMMRPEGEELTMTGTMLGTPQYMAPEQLTSSRTVDGRADLYALGTVLYEMVSGVLPYDAKTLAALIASKMSDAPRPLAQTAPDVPGPLGAIILRLLAWDPNARFATAAEVEHALADAAQRISSGGSFRPPATGADAIARTEIAPGLASGGGPSPSASGAGPMPAGPRPALAQSTIDSLPGIVNASAATGPGTTEAPFRRMLMIAAALLLALLVLGTLAIVALGGLAYVGWTRTADAPAVTTPSAPTESAPGGSAPPLPTRPAGAAPPATSTPSTPLPAPALPPPTASVPASAPPEGGPAPTSGGRWALRGVSIGIDGGSVALIERTVRPLLERCPAPRGYLVNIQTTRFAAGGGNAMIFPPHEDRGDPSSRCLLRAFEDAMRTLPAGSGIQRFEISAE
jgi:serine/threonine-protein kinase